VVISKENPENTTLRAKPSRVVSPIVGWLLTWGALISGGKVLKVIHEAGTIRRKQSKGKGTCPVKSFERFSRKVNQTLAGRLARGVDGISFGRQQGMVKDEK